MITRRRVSGGITLLVAHRLSRAQPAGPPRRVGILEVLSEAGAAHRRAAFEQGMRELGWLDGQSVEYRFVYAESDVNRLDTLVGELITRKVEVIVVGAGPSARAAQRATRAIPIVLVNVSNVVANGFAASLARPGGNITGITTLSEVLGKQIQLLHEATPLARRFAILLNDSNPSYAANWAIAQNACAALNLLAMRVVASTPAQIQPAVEQIASQRSQAVVVVTDPVYTSEGLRLQELLQGTRLPVAYGLREHVVAGGLLGYGSNFAANLHYAAKFVDKILKGAKPADLPVEQPTRFDLWINLKTAKALGLTIPQSLLLRADEVIQ